MAPFVCRIEDSKETPPSFHSASATMATLLDPSAQPSQGGPHEGLVATIDVGFTQNSSAANLRTSSVQAGSYINSSTLQFNSASGAQTYSLSGTSGSSVASDRADSDTHPDLSHVLSGFQQTGELNSVLQQRPELVQGEITKYSSTPSQHDQSICLGEQACARQRLVSRE